MAQPKSCKHCGKAIKKVRFALGEKWVHYTPGAGSHNDHWFCHRTTAEPGERKRRLPEPMPTKKVTPIP
jgi:hypothetical protein